MSRFLRRCCVLLGLTAVATGVWTPGAEASTKPTSRVIVVGVPGLRWADLSPSGTPTLWALAGRGAVGALSVRTVGAVTCPGDGWVALGAGNRARDPQAEHREVGCPEVAVPAADAGLAARVAQVRADNAGLAFDAPIGALADAVQAAGGCVGAEGTDGAVLAATDSAGRVRRGAAAVGCDVRVIGAPPVGGIDRAADAAAADATVRAAAAGLDPARDLLLVAGFGETGPGPVAHLHVLIAAGPGFTGGALVSPTTRRAPYVQLIDLAPTVLSALGVPAPREMAGRPLRVSDGSGFADGSTADVVRRLVDLDVAAQANRRLVPPFFAVLVVGQALLYALAWVVLRRVPAPRRRSRVLRVTEVAAVAGAAAIPATFLANLVPWWRADRPVGVLLASIAAAAAAITAAAYAGPWRRTLLGPSTALVVITAAVLAGDLLTGGRLQMFSLAGYSPLVAGRFAGVGNVAFAVLATSALLTAALVTARLAAPAAAARLAAVVVAGIGAVTVVVDGAPHFGDDFGGVIALVVGFALLGLLVAGARVTAGRLLVIGVVALVAVSGFALLDYARPEQDQTHLGRFVGQVLHGGAATIVQRKLSANLHLLTHSVLTLLVPLAVALVAALVLRPTGALRRAMVAAPALRRGLIAVLAAGVVGALVNDSGVAIPAVAMTIAVPVAIAVSAAVARVAAPTYDDTRTPVPDAR